MARGINKVILIGSAGNDAEVRYMPSGAAVANVSLATNESWTDKQTGQKQERVEWHRVAFMDRGNFRLGQIAGDFIKKGSKVYVEGALRTREWEKDGVKRYTTEIIANEMQLLDGRQDDQQGQQGQQGQGGYSGQQAPQNSNYGPQGGQQPRQGYGNSPQQNQQPQQNSQPQQGGYGQPQSFGSWGNSPQPQQGGYGDQSGGTQNRRGPAPQQQQRPMSQQASPQQPAPDFDAFDDDIPFSQVDGGRR